MKRNSRSQNRNLSGSRQSETSRCWRCKKKNKGGKEAEWNDLKVPYGGKWWFRHGCNHCSSSFSTVHHHAGLIIFSPFLSNSNIFWGFLLFGEHGITVKVWPHLFIVNMVFVIQAAIFLKVANDVHLSTRLPCCDSAGCHSSVMDLLLPNSVAACDEPHHSALMPLFTTLF